MLKKIFISIMPSIAIASTHMPTSGAPQDLAETNLDIRMSDRLNLEVPYGKFGPTESGARNSIALGISPAWTEFDNDVDKDRKGYGGVTIYKSKKNKSKPNSELDIMLEKYKK